MLNQRGMSLIELLISMSILTVVVGAAISFLIFSQRQYSWIDTQSRIQQELRTTLQEMTIDTKEARFVDASSVANRMVLSLPNMNTGTGDVLGYDTIIYEPMPGDTPNLQMTLHKGTGSSRSGWGKLVQSGNPSTWLLTVGLFNSGLTDDPPLFSYSDTASISSSTRVAITLRARRVASFGKTQEATLSTDIRLRNKRTD